MIDIYLCPSNPQCSECHYILDVRPLPNGLHKVIHSPNHKCVNSNKHFIVRFPRLEVLAESEAVEERTSPSPTPAPWMRNEPPRMLNHIMGYDLAYHNAYQYDAQTYNDTPTTMDNIQHILSEL